MKLKHLISPPYNLLMFSGSLLAVFSFFCTEKFDFHLHDTLFVVGSSYVLWPVSIILVVFWMIYRASEKNKLSVVLTWAHVASTLLCLASFLIFGFLFDKRGPALSRTVLYWQEEDRKKALAVASFVLIFILGQLVFVINIIFGALKYLVKGSSRSVGK